MPRVSAADAKIVFQDGGVFMIKRRPQHGTERVPLADDVDYYRRAREVFIKPSNAAHYNTPVKWGCPYDRGLCTDHYATPCPGEICDACNLRCPVHAGSDLIVPCSARSITSTHRRRRPQ